MICIRRKILLVLVLLLCCVSAWADSITEEVTTQAVFTATNGATETMSMSFEYITPSPNFENGQIVAGTMDMSSSGFLGTFSDAKLFSDFIGTYNFMGDEIDLLGEFNNGFNNSNYLYLWGCQSQACFDAYGVRWTNFGPNNDAIPTYSSTSVVRVPDGTSFPLMVLASFLTVAMLWKYRRVPNRA
jgi:hypothetical protein